MGDISEGEENVPSSVKRVGGSPRLKGLFAIQEENLHTLLLLKPITCLPTRFHGLPLLGKRIVEAASGVHEDGAGDGAVGSSDKTLGFNLAVVVRDKGQTANIALGGPGRISPKDQVDKGYLLRLGGRGGGAAVVELNGPLGKCPLEEVDKVVLHDQGVFGARDAGYQDGCEEGAVVDVEIRTS